MLKNFWLPVVIAMSLLGLPAKAADEQICLVIHGGAGVEAGMSEADQKECHKALDLALQAGLAVFQKGGTAVEMVEASVRSLEDCPLFNAGRGAVFSADSKNELDAAIMDGKNHKAGAVAGLTTIKNPITEAVAIMEKSPHVMLVGQGAEQFARDNGVETVDPQYFFTQKRWDALQKKIETDKNKKGAVQTENKAGDHKYGTVGAVARDKAGNLAAGTSTGGLTGKRWGRVGDTPVIGAGTYADNDSCAVSCTGEGEWFIRYTVASDLAARMKYRNDSVSQAGNAIIHGVLGPGHGEGGLIAIDSKGNFAMPFNCEGMYRGYADEKGNRKTFIYE